MQKRNTGSIQKNQDGLLLQRKPLVQARTNRNHSLLPSDFHEQLSDAGKSYWNQLPYEEQNKLIQQCRMPMNEMPGVKAELSSQSGEWNKRPVYQGTWSRHSAQSGDWRKPSLHFGDWSKQPVQSVEWSRQSVQLGCQSKQSTQPGEWSRQPVQMEARNKLSVQGSPRTERSFVHKVYSSEGRSVSHKQYESVVYEGKYSGNRDAYKKVSNPRLIKYRVKNAVLQESGGYKIPYRRTLSGSNQQENVKYKDQFHNGNVPFDSPVQVRNWNREVLIKDSVKRNSPQIIQKPYTIQIHSVRKQDPKIVFKQYKTDCKSIRRNPPRIVPKSYQFYLVTKSKSGFEKIPVLLRNKTAEQWKRHVQKQLSLPREESLTYEKKPYGTDPASVYMNPRHKVKSGRYKMNPVRFLVRKTIIHYAARNYFSVRRIVRRRKGNSKRRYLVYNFRARKVVRKQKVKVKKAQLAIRSLNRNDIRRYIPYRTGNRKRTQGSFKGAYRLPVRSRCRKRRKHLRVLSVILIKGRTFRFIGKYQKISELYRYRPGYSRFRRYVLRYEKNRVFRHVKNLGSNRYRSVRESDSRKKSYPDFRTWKRKRNKDAKRKAFADKKKNRLDKKQMKRLIKRIEYLAALTGAVREKESNPAQELKAASLLVMPATKVTVKAVLNFVRSRSVVAMITGNLAQIISGMITAFSAALSSMMVPILTVMVPVVMVLDLLACLIPAFNLAGGYSGSASQYDVVCYLTAKYESGGDAASVGEDVGYLAYGEFQFYYMYELRPFIRWCYEKDPAFYKAFEPYLNMDVNQVPGEDFRAVWKKLAESDYSAFELAQEEYICTFTLEPTLEKLTEKYGYDFTHADNALKACVLSFANRSGKSMATLARYYDGTTAESTEEEIINRAYAAMYAQRPIRRWDKDHEWKDCLDQLAGTLDIYAKSENSAGGIDWSWKKTAPGRIVDATGDDIVDYALQFVGNSYVWGGDSLTGGIDCSHFIWRVLLNTGHYSGDYLTSDGWRNVGERVEGLSNAIAGDVICYEGHVAFYDGNGYLVEAKNSREGITHDEKPDYMPIVCIRRIR